MKLVAGARLASAVCDTQVAVILAPTVQGTLTCGGVAMEELGKTSAPESRLTVPESGYASPGKRYVDETAGLELLCTKGGKGALAFDGRPLTLKQAKPLPASD